MLRNSRVWEARVVEFPCTAGDLISIVGFFCAEAFQDPEMAVLSKVLSRLLVFLSCRRHMGHWVPETPSRVCFPPGAEVLSWSLVPAWYSPCHWYTEWLKALLLLFYYMNFILFYLLKVPTLPLIQLPCPQTPRTSPSCS